MTACEQQTLTTLFSFVGCQNFQRVVLSSLNCGGVTSNKLRIRTKCNVFLFDFLLLSKQGAAHKGYKFVFLVWINVAAFIIPFSSSRYTRLRTDSATVTIKKVTTIAAWRASEQDIWGLFAFFSTGWHYKNDLGTCIQLWTKSPDFLLKKTNERLKDFYILIPFSGI